MYPWEIKHQKMNFGARVSQTTRMYYHNGRFGFMHKSSKFLLFTHFHSKQKRNDLILETRTRQFLAASVEEENSFLKVKRKQK